MSAKRKQWRTPGGDFQLQHERRIQKQDGGKGNFMLDQQGDLVVRNPLTQHARERRKERGISDKDALNRYAKTASDGVITTVYKKNEQRQLIWTPPLAQDLPVGHKIECVQAPGGAVGHIIGAKGRNIDALKKKHKVECRVAKNKFGSKQNVFAWGPSQGVDGAVADIIEIIRNQQIIEEKTLARAAAKKERELSSAIPRDLPAGHKFMSRKLPLSITKLLIGKQQRKIKSLTEKHIVNYAVRREKKKDQEKTLILFWGPEKAVDDVLKEVDESISKQEKLVVKRKEKNARKK